MQIYIVGVPLCYLPWTNRLVDHLAYYLLASACYWTIFWSTNPSAI
ncbi:hypothetical protein ACRRVD_00795 [Candidatus Cardinium hertigii]